MLSVERKLLIYNPLSFGLVEKTEKWEKMKIVAS